VIRKAALTATLAAMISLALAPPASATFPGRNGRIAYTNNNQQISLVKPDGTGKRTLTSFANGFVEAPMVSADGQWIVFDGSTTGDIDLYVMRSDGSHRRKITDTAAYEWSPSWSPNGRWIVFAGDGANSAIRAIHPDGTHRHRIGTGTGEYPRFSPDGKKIAYGASDGEIHVMNADGTHDHALTNAGGGSPDWSPSGRLIGYSSSSSGSSQVWIMRADGSHKHQVTTIGGIFFSPVFSPDGTRIAYTTGSGGSPIWVSRLDGSHTHQVVASQGACCIGWQPLP
jgi:Tol biopolymer transport system component